MSSAVIRKKDIHYRLLIIYILYAYTYLLCTLQLCTDCQVSLANNSFIMYNYAVTVSVCRVDAININNRHGIFRRRSRFN